MVKINKRYFDGIKTWPVIRSWIVKMIAMTPAATFWWALICYIISWQEPFSADWAQFWKVAPYVAMAALLANMLRIKGDQEQSLSVFLILAYLLILVPIDIYLSGAQKVLKYSFLGFLSGWAVMGLIVFPVITIHYSKTASGSISQNITDNFNKENFLLGLVLSIFLAFSTALGHAIIVLFNIV